MQVKQYETKLQDAEQRAKEANDRVAELQACCPPRTQRDGQPYLVHLHLISLVPCCPVQAQLSSQPMGGGGGGFNRLQPGGMPGTSSSRMFKPAARRGSVSLGNQQAQMLSMFGGGAPAPAPVGGMGGFTPMGGGGGGSGLGAINEAPAAAAAGGHVQTRVVKAGYLIKSSAGKKDDHGKAVKASIAVGETVILLTSPMHLLKVEEGAAE